MKFAHLALPPKMCTKSSWCNSLCICVRTSAWLRTPRYSSSLIRESFLSSDETRCWKAAPTRATRSSCSVAAFTSPASIKTKALRVSSSMRSARSMSVIFRSSGRISSRPAGVGLWAVASSSFSRVVRDPPSTNRMATFASKSAAVVTPSSPSAARGRRTWPTGAVVAGLEPTPGLGTVYCRAATSESKAVTASGSTRGRDGRRCVACRCVATSLRTGLCRNAARAAPATRQVPRMAPTSSDVTPMPKSDVT
mmetsp:Transcript_13284/g.36602  ORF Transcript_13284/g.36602 Transcript_13284/m.36602 type:complete len:252 (+) Transcript_13284:137-892(+)